MIAVNLALEVQAREATEDHPYLPDLKSCGNKSVASPLAVFVFEIKLTISHNLT